MQFMLLFSGGHMTAISNFLLQGLGADTFAGLSGVACWLQMNNTPTQHPIKLAIDQNLASAAGTGQILISQWSFLFGSRRSINRLLPNRLAERLQFDQPCSLKDSSVYSDSGWVPLISMVRKELVALHCGLAESLEILSAFLQHEHTCYHMYI